MPTLRHALVAAVLLAVTAAARGACDADLDGDDEVGFQDLLAVLSTWGPCPGCPEDLDGDDVVAFSDLLIVLSTWGPCPGDAIETELAGRGLTRYPYFEYVRAFNENTAVQVAIDPSAHPEVADTAALLWIVADRSAAEWDADPILVDVRGGPQGVFLGSPGVQDATVAVSGAALSGDGGIDFGVGYDVVLDLDLDGALGAGDVIDGRGDEAGFTVVKDTTTPGALAVTSVTYSGGTFLGQKTWYPTDIGSMGALPLVVISHGNGHQYTWYDYLQSHLASYGYVVMSHQNNTMPGIETASETTLTNTDYFLDNLGTIAGGVLDGHVDSSRITWIGHSRGGEGVARAYDRLFDGDFVPSAYTVDDVVLVSSISPNDYLGRLNSNPHDVHYHVLQGAGDGDNAGWPDAESDAPYHVYERAEGRRQATYVHGADHNDFNCCGFNDFQGPPATEIGRSEAQRVAKGAYLALIKHYIDGSSAAKDFLWRQYEVLRPIGVAPTTTVVREYVEGSHPGTFVVDDFQTQTSIGTSSSGGAVTFDVANAFEGQQDDTDGTFTWSTGDPMNGMVRGRPDDVTRGLVFDFSNGDQRFLEFEIVPGERDLTLWSHLAFRMCQGTRHPQTTGESGNASCTVTLRDAGGGESSIDFGAYGGGIQEPYQRTGSGSGAGWQNEYETIRMRLTDFTRNGAAIDLTDVVAIRFEFGAGLGSSRGRFGIDDVALSADVEP